MQGATRPTQLITWTRADGAPLNLTGALITGRIYNLATRRSRDIAGSLSVTDPGAGRFTWSYGNDDIAEAGQFEVQFTASYPESPSPARTFLQAWTVEHSL